MATKRDDGKAKPARPRARSPRADGATKTAPVRKRTPARPQPPAPADLSRQWQTLPTWLLGAALALTLIAAIGAVRLQADAHVDLLSDPGSTTYRQQAQFANTFGADPVVVLLEQRGNHPLLTGTHFVAFATLEGKLARAKGVQRVYGPGTLVNTFANQVTQRLVVLCQSEGTAAEAAARQKALQQGKNSQQQQAAGNAAFATAVRACLNALLAEFPSIGVPALNNPSFIRAVVLEPNGRQIRPFWNWALPDPRHAVITVRMKRSASLADVRAVVADIATARRDPALQDIRIVDSGAPVLTLALADDALPPVHGGSDLAAAVAHRTLLGLLPLTVIAMVVVTLLVLRVPYRLLAVPVAVVATLWAAGAAGWLRLPVTPATLAVLPVVLGLATDYSLQACNRLAQEEPGRGRLSVALRAIVPPTLTAAIATGLGVLAFALSPIPLVKQFAAFLALGVAAAYLAFALVCLPALARLAGRPGPAARPPAWPALARLGGLPLAAVAVLVLVGLPGWVALSRLPIETDPTKLLPASDPAVANAQAIHRAIGLAGELDLVLVGPNTASPAALGWMAGADHRIVSASGGELKSLTGLPEFLEGFNHGQIPSQQATNLILQRVPGYFTGAVISPNHRLARTPFGLTRVTSVAEDQRLVHLLSSLPPPPPGYHAYPAGLAVVAAQALAQLSGDQLKLNLLALGLVLIVLTLAYRDPLPAALAVVPTAVAGGWATGVIFLLGLRSSPITVLLAGVVVAFATEFSVLWLSRYRTELRAGADPLLAAEAASSRIGPAIVASALALVVGFALLASSPVPMVRDFGIWSAADLALATLAVLVLLPPLARAWLRRPDPRFRVPFRV